MINATNAGVIRVGRFLDLLENYGLLDDLANPNTFVTVFAPTDSAFASRPLASSSYVQRRQILSHHITQDINSPYYSYSFFQGQRITTMTTAPNAKIVMSVEPGRDRNLIYANRARVLTPDFRANNGVVHIISNVLQLYAPTTKKQKGYVIKKTKKKGGYMIKKKRKNGYYGTLNKKNRKNV